MRTAINAIIIVLKDNLNSSIEPPVLTSSEFGDFNPHQIVPKLADQGIYLGSEATMYRL